MARILGLDPGTKRCGVALTDSEQRMAFPREALLVGPDLMSQLATLISEESVVGVVVGLPHALSGAETASTHNATAFFNDVCTHFPELAIIQFDERLTTKQASYQLSQAGHKIAKQRNIVDSAAAVIMLESYLEGLPRD
jgi:putative Holliday junction resolvase